MKDVRTDTSDEEYIDLGREQTDVAIPRRIYSDSKLLTQKQPNISLGQVEVISSLEDCSLRLEAVLQEAKKMAPFKMFNSDHFFTSTKRLTGIWTRPSTIHSCIKAIQELYRLEHVGTEKQSVMQNIGLSLMTITLELQ